MPRGTRTSAAIAVVVVCVACSPSIAPPPSAPSLPEGWFAMTACTLDGRAMPARDEHVRVARTGWLQLDARVRAIDLPHP